MQTTVATKSRTLRSAAVVAVAVGIVMGVYSLGDAGSLAPLASPAETLDDVGSVYDTIASSGYDSSSFLADPNGGAFELAKCAIARITGGSCP